MEEKEEKEEVPFKKPVLVGKVGRLPKKVIPEKPAPPASVASTDAEPVQQSDPVELPKESPLVPAQKLTENPIPYKEPNWSGLPKTGSRSYIFEVLKNGSIIETIDLMTKPYWVFGRLTNCDICMQHPTISRCHAVLQYRSEATETDTQGFYIYDLGSTHGTFLNKNRLKNRTYTRMQVGHMLKLGCSTRTYILNGPDDDEEAESEFTVTELKQQRQEELLRREEAAREALLEKQRKEEEMKKKEEERGVDWGLGEDAEEEPDLSENPYAQTNNEELYLDNPKKALRGFFEREGLELEYDCSEQGMGQFLCKVELPVDDEMGRPIFAEVIHKGKKKEAVVQCALEACRILDRYGLLRQATHESRKRKPKNWEENDYYDSDDDTFFDRTGTVEKKREMRMKMKMPQKAETYDSLLEREKSINENIKQIEAQLAQATKSDVQNTETSEEDSLDTFMKDLKQSKPDKQAINKLKSDLVKLKQEHSKVVKLVNIAKPTNLPDLVVSPEPTPGTSSQTKAKSLPMFGKRKKIKLQLPVKATHEMTVDDEDDETEENEPPAPAPALAPAGSEDNQETETPAQDSMEVNEEPVETASVASAPPQEDSSSSTSTENVPTGDSSCTLLTLVQFEKILEKQKLPQFSGKHREKLSRILHKLKKLASDGDRMDVDWKMLEAKKRKIMKLISDLNDSEPNEKLEYKVSAELGRILNELNAMTDQKFKVISKVKKMGDELKSMSEEIGSDLRSRLGNMEEEEAGSSKSQSVDKKEKQKEKQQQRVEQERQRGYDEDSTREDYSMWVPPSDQSGDGRTSLNEKYGY